MGVSWQAYTRDIVVIIIGWVRMPGGWQIAWMTLCARTAKATAASLAT